MLIYALFNFKYFNLSNNLRILRPSLKFDNIMLHLTVLREKDDNEENSAGGLKFCLSHNT